MLLAGQLLVAFVIPKGGGSSRRIDAGEEGFANKLAMLVLAVLGHSSILKR